MQLPNFHHANKRLFVFAFVAAFVVIGVAAFAMYAPRDTTHTITLTDAGFAPKVLRIQAGDTVAFVNKRAEPFWPASDLHPTHALYAEFDSREPLPAGSIWEFTFTEEGNWTYHDHLVPLYQGLITVSEEGKEVETQTYEDCSVYESMNERTYCWNEQLKAAYAQGGVEQGLKRFEELFNKETEFSTNCHTFTHTLGQLAYEDYRSGKNFDVTNQVAYCSYGFFHGFMEVLVFETGDYNGAREFCDYIETRLGGAISSVGPCIHGIGHGLTDGYDPRIGGDAQKLIAEPLAICNEVTRDDYEEMICATGVFNSLGELYLRDKESGLLDSESIYSICGEQEKDNIKIACYEDLKIVPLALENQQLEPAIGHVLRIDDELRFKKRALENLALYFVYNITENGYTESISVCQSLEEQLRSSCFRGIASGFINSGPPDKEYVRALDFCSVDTLSEDDRRNCYERLLSAAFTRYAPETFDIICGIVPAEYHHSTFDGSNLCSTEKV